MKKFDTVDQYMAESSAATRPLLEEMRAIIKKEAPEAEERISYGMPGYFYNGALVYFGGFKNHVSLFGTSSLSADRFKDDLQDYKTSKGTIQFPLDAPLPTDLVRKLVKFRVKENLAKKQ